MINSMELKAISEVYQSPQAVVRTMENEMVLCASGGNAGSFDDIDWDEE